MKNSVFYDSVPAWLIKVSLSILMSAQILIAAIPANAIGMVTSFLGDEKDTIQFIYYGGVVANAAAYPLIGRLLRYFRKKQLLLFTLLLELIFLLLSVCSTNALQLFIFNFFLSSFKMVGLITTIVLFLEKFNPSNSRGYFYALYYTISFCIGQIYAYWVALILETYTWKYTFLISLPGILISILLVSLLFHSHRTEKKYPLYQVDWLGYFLFVVASLCLAFVCIFGERLEWMENELIGFMVGATLITYLLWVIRMLYARRPYVDIRALAQYKQALVGVLFMMLMFLVYNTLSITTEFMTVSLGYDGRYVAAANLYLIIPFLCVIPLTGYWLHKVRRAREPLILSFLLFALYYGYTAQFFYPEENTHFFLIPMMIRGAAYGMCITSLSYYASMNIPAKPNNYRAFASIVSRSVIAAPITSALCLHCFNYFKDRQYNMLSAVYAMDDFRVSSLWKGLVSAQLKKGFSMQEAEQMAQAALHKLIYKEALIYSIQNIHYVLAAVSLILALAVACLKIFNLHYQVEKNNHHAQSYVDL